MSQPPQLSITFLTPGKKKTLERCLESIRWMQQEFPCELVIVDTGCDAEHRALIDAYADTIVDFEWIDDFSAARNAGIAACTGEWFMIMDDDEVIKDYGPLVEFFSSGEYRNHQWMKTIEHDYIDWEESACDQYYWIRAVRRDPSFHYVGKIHEYIVGPTTEPVGVPAVFGHYGYIYESEQQKHEHGKRNITLLEAGLRDDPDNLHYAMQLSQEYHVMKNRAKKEAICEKYYPMARLSPNPNAGLWRDILYCGWVDAVFAKGNDERTIAMVQQGLAKEPLKDEAKTYLYCVGAHAYYRSGAYDQCVACAKTYFASYEKYAEKVALMSAYFFVKTAYEVYQQQQVAQCVALCGIRQKNYVLVEEYTNRIDWTDKRLELHDDLYEVLKLSTQDAEMCKLASRMMRQILAVPRLKVYLLTILEDMDYEFAPLYLELDEVGDILPYIKYQTFLRMKELGFNPGRMGQLPKWQNAKIRAHFALDEFLGGQENLELQNQVLDRFVVAGEEYYRIKYTEKALQREICLSKEALLWKRMSEVMDNVHKNQPTEALQVAKTAMGLDSIYDNALARWIRGYADSISKIQVSVSEEMIQLGQQIKSQARELIATGDIEMAKSILVQLQGLLPQDEEINEMLAGIRT